MDFWKTWTFGDLLAEPVRNGIYKKKEFHGRGQKIINMGDLFSYDFISNQEMKRIELNDRELANNLVQDGDLLFARRSFVLEGAGKCSLVVQPSEDTTFESSVIRVRLNPEKANPRFYYYLFRSPQGRALISSITTGAVVSGIRGSELVLLKVPKPPLHTQHKIAAILSPYDDLIENNTRRIQILEEMAQIIYRQWFVEFQFPGHEKVPMVESELGVIPQGWEVGKVGDVAESVRRNIKPSDINQETPYFGLKHLPRKSIALSNWDSVDSINSAKLAFKKGEILFGKIRPYFHKVGVAPLDGICSSDTIVIRPKRNECFAITLATVSSEHFIKYATATSQGTNMPRANWEVLAKYPIVLPPLEISQQFNNLVQDKVDMIHSLVFRNKNLRQTRDLLLPKLISGELDVSELDINIDGIQPRKGGTPIPYPLTERLHSDEKILGGKPVIRGTRLAVAFILELLENGWSEAEVLENYPSIVREDIDACLAYQQQVTDASISR